MKKFSILFFALALPAALFAAPRTYTFGKVQVAQNNELPSGHFAKAQNYLPGDNISITNPDTGKEINVLNLGTLPEAEDVALLLAPEAASRLGIDHGSSLQVKLSPRPDNFDEIASGTAVLSYSAVASANSSDADRIPSGGALGEPEADLSAVAQPAESSEGSGSLGLIFSSEVLEKLGMGGGSSPALDADSAPPEEIAESPVADGISVEVKEPVAAETPSGGREIAKAADDGDSLLERLETMELAPVGNRPPVADTPASEPPRTMEEPPAINSDEPDVVIFDEVSEPVVVTESPGKTKTYVTSKLPDGSVVQYEEEEYTEESDIMLIPTGPMVPEYNPAYAVKETPKAPKKDGTSEAGKEKPADKQPAVQPENAVAAKPAEPKVQERDCADVVAAKPEPQKEAPAPGPEPDPVAGVSSSGNGATSKSNDVVAFVPVEAVTPKPTPAESAATGNASSVDGKIIKDSDLPKGYYIQIATTSTKEGAEKLVQKHKKYPVVLVPFTTRSGYKVLVGPLSGDEYGAVLTKFKAFGYKDAFLRKVE